MVPSKDPEYDKAKSGFIRELAQFHESRGTSMKCTPKINGKEVDVYLLYQIVTSHGGWEKVNIRNEWDELLEHFDFPRATNGGLAIKQIYLRYLELFEKIHFLGEDVDGRVEEDEDLDDSRHRRRHYPNKQSSISTPLNQISHHSITAPVSFPDHVRSQYGLTTRHLIDSDYDRLVVSLQSPLPNEQDLAVSVCTLLSNESKHVLKFTKAPQLLNLILAHTGIYNDCALRTLFEETYSNGRGLSHKHFWDEHISNSEIKKLLCEYFIRNEQLSLCVHTEDEVKYSYRTELELEYMHENDLTEEDKAVINFQRKKRRRMLELENNKNGDDIPNEDVRASLKTCCSLCPCQKCTERSSTDSISYPYVKAGPSGSDDKIGQRILQITNIIRNLSFEEDNALLMASNPSMLRFLLLAANCSWCQLPQLSYDIMGNLAKHLKLQEPTLDPLSSMLIDLVTNGLFSTDRFKILRSLETLRELSKNDENEFVITRYFEKKIYSRLTELLTVSDIMLLIYTLECILSMTNMSEAVCNDLVAVVGSVSTLVSLVTVEAQSYGPKGCILMRVVETVTGASVSQSSQQGVSATTTVRALSPPTIHPTIVQSQLAPIAPNSPHAPIASTSMQTLSTRLTINGPSSSFSSFSSTTATGTTVIPPTHPPTSSSLNALSSKSLILPAATTATPVSIPLSSTTLSTNSPTPLSIYDGSNSNCSTLTVTTTLSSASSLNQIQFPPLTAFSSSPLSPNTTPTPINPVPPQYQPQNTLGLQAIIQTSSISPNKVNYSVTNSVASFSDINDSQLSPKSIVPNIVAANKISTTVTTNSSDTNPSTSPKLNGSPAGATPVTTTTVGTLAQVSNQSLNQQIFSPSISLVTPRGTLSEEGWAIAWLKGALELSSGSSIEEGELYRMYRCARKNPNVILQTEQFIQCVKCAYGTGVGPVIKQFGSTCLTFFDGVRPKIANRTAATSLTAETAASPSSPQIMSSISTPIASSVIVVPGGTPTAKPSTPSSTNSQVQPAAQPSMPQPASALPVSVHIPSRENKTMSPILKATLSRPPKPKNPSGVTLRQQKKMQQDKTTGNLSANETDERADTRVNGIDGNMELEESSASSSLNSSEGSESTKEKVTPVATLPLTSFQGILRNGLTVEEFKGGDSNSDDINKGTKLKTMLIDLLERKVPAREPINGLLNREIRISDKGLELVDNKLQEETNSNSSSAASISVFNLNTNTNNSVSDSQDSQQMTFYSSSSDAQVTFQGQVQSSCAPLSPLSMSSMNSNAIGTVLMSGGGGGDEKSSIQVKTQGLHLVDIASSVDVGVCIGVGIGDGDGNGNSSSSGGGTSASSPCHSSGGSGDLLEKFNQISDLIVVPPEQLGLKRTHSQSQSTTGTISNENCMDDNKPPPFKKPAIAVNGNGCVEESDIQKTNSQPSTPAKLPENPVMNATSANCTTTTISTATINNNSHTNDIKNSSSSANNNQVMQLPLRLAVSSPNSQQLGFGQMRQLVIQSGQVILPPNNSQNPLQGHMIISKPHNASNDQIPKAIIILSSQQHSQQQTPTQTNSGNNPTTCQSLQPLPVSSVQQQTVHPNPCTTPPQPVIPGASPPTPGWVGAGFTKEAIARLNLTPEQLDIEIPYLCEWAGCGMRFPRPHQVYMHAMSIHCSEVLVEAVKCKWGSNGCDPLIRKRYSLMTHLQDRHCSVPALEMALYRRRNKIEPPPAPQQPIHHPGYAPNAAFHAIKRHAMQFMNPKELLDDNEGPVTKSIRLTSALILRNLVNFSDLGRKMCSSYESHFSAIAMSNVESSRTIAQILYDMNELDTRSRIVR